MLFYTGSSNLRDRIVSSNKSPIPTPDQPTLLPYSLPKLPKAKPWLKSVDQREHRVGEDRRSQVGQTRRVNRSVSKRRSRERFLGERPLDHYRVSCSKRSLVSGVRSVWRLVSRFTPRDEVTAPVYRRQRRRRASLAGVPTDMHQERDERAGDRKKTGPARERSSDQAVSVAANRVAHAKSRLGLGNVSRRSCYAAAVPRRSGKWTVRLIGRTRTWKKVEAPRDRDRSIADWTVSMI